MLIWVVLFVSGQNPERWSPLHHHNGGSGPRPEVKSRCCWSLSQERETGDGRCLSGCSLISVLFLSCATVMTQRMRDGRTSSQQHGRPSVSALTSTYLVCSIPTRHQPLGSTEEDRLPYIALIIAWFWLVLCHCQGSSNMKWLLLCKFIGVLQYEIVFTLQDY